MTRARDRSNWWAIPLALVVGATLAFLALAAPRWTHGTAVPSAISIRPDARSTPSPSQHPSHHNHAKNHRHHTPRPTATATVTVIATPAPAPTVPVKVVTPKRHVVTAKPSHSDDRHDDGKGKPGRDN